MGEGGEGLQEGCVEAWEQEGVVGAQVLDEVGPGGVLVASQGQDEVGVSEVGQVDGARAAGVAGEGAQLAVLEELVQGGGGVQDVGGSGQSDAGAGELLGQAGQEVGELDGRRQEDDGGAARVLGGAVLGDGGQDLPQGAGGAGGGHGNVEPDRFVVEALGRAVADKPDQVVVGVAAPGLVVGGEVEPGADDDGVLAGQGEVDQVQQGGVDGADDGQGVPAVGRGAGDVSEVAGKVIRGIGHEVLQQS